MHFENRMSKNIPLEKDEMKDKGLVERYLPFLADIFSTKEDKILPLAIKIGQFFTGLGVSEAVRLEINDAKISSGSGKVEPYRLIGMLQGYGKRINKIHLVGRIKANDLEITSIVKLESLDRGSSARITIENYGMAQVPKNLKAETFEEDIKKLLSQGYLDECEKTFIEHSNNMVRNFKRVFSADLTVSKLERSIIIPSKQDKKISKFYNRRFNDQTSIYSPVFYKSTGVNPDYSYRGYTDPFEVYWWMMIFDHTSGSSRGSDNFIDSRGNEISRSDANTTVKDLNQNTLSHQLSESSSNFEPGKYETFPQSVEASRYEGNHSKQEKDHERDNDRYSQADNSAAYVAGDSGSSHSKGSSHSTSHDSGGGSHDSGSSCSGNHSSCSGGSCSGGSCSGGSSCGGGGCGGGGCGGG